MPPARGQANPLFGWIFSVSEGTADFRFTTASVLGLRDIAMVTNRSSRKLEMAVPILAQDDFFAMRGKEHITYAIHAPRSLLAFMNCHGAILQKSGDAPYPVGAVRPAGLIEKITRSVSERSENRTTALLSDKLPLDRNSGCMRFPEHPFGNTIFQGGNWLPQKTTTSVLPARRRLLNVWRFHGYEPDQRRRQPNPANSWSRCTTTRTRNRPASSRTLSSASWTN